MELMIVKDELAEMIDDIAALCEHWSRNRDKGRMPYAIRRAIIMAARDAIAFEDSQVQEMVRDQDMMFGPLAYHRNNGKKDDA